MEQILDKLVLEQFMISMPPELQVLVKDHNVQSCKDLEDILRRKEKPKKYVSRNLRVSLGKGGRAGRHGGWTRKGRRDRFYNIGSPVGNPR